MNTMLATPSNPASQKRDQRAGKYLTFALGSEEFAIQVMRVREIMGIQEITAVPQTPGYVKGVLNLRGKVVPVVDLRMKFDMRELDYTERTCIIVAQIEVAQIEGQEGKMLIGVIVDGVSEVLTLGAEDIEDTPDFGSRIETPHILGMAKVKNKVKILLDINMVFTAQEVERFLGATV
jgi:purine-binding chemotaxis protein CheW